MTECEPTWRSGVRRSHRHGPGGVRPEPISISGVRCGDGGRARALARCLGRPGAAGRRRVLHHGVGPRPRGTRRRGDHPRGASCRYRALESPGRRRHGTRGGTGFEARPAGLRATPDGLSPSRRRGAGASRSPLHDASPVAGAVCRHDPRLHLLRPSGMAPPLQSHLLPPRHSARRTSRRSADLRESRDGGQVAPVV